MLAFRRPNLSSRSFILVLAPLVLAADAFAYDPMLPALYQCYNKLTTMVPENDGHDTPKDQELSRNYRIVFNARFDGVDKRSEFDRFLVAH